MITKNDLYDISFVLILIRDNIREELNTKILCKIIDVLQTEITTEDNQIRKAISAIEGLDSEHWYFVFYKNVYVNHQFLKNEKIYALLVKLLQTLINEINQENFDKAYDMIDCFHCLPEIIADNNLSIPKSFWKTFVKSYRNKWDNTFLKNEQTNYKNYLKNTRVRSKTSK